MQEFNQGYTAHLNDTVCNGVVDSAGKRVANVCKSFDGRLYLVEDGTNTYSANYLCDALSKFVTAQLKG